MNAQTNAQTHACTCSNNRLLHTNAHTQKPPIGNSIHIKVTSTVLNWKV